MGSLLVVSFGCWSVTVLVMSSLFWTYVGLHWDGNVEHSFPGFSASEAETHVQLTVISVGVLSLFSCCILVRQSIIHSFVSAFVVLFDMTCVH